MSDAITPELFDHLVILAALELDQEEAEYLRRELNHQLKAIHELEAIPLSPETMITSHGVPYTAEITPPIRPDEWIPNQEAGKFLQQAPKTQQDYIVVPDIPHTELE